jgi:carbon-monoxide dehydrogenase medium subunit
MPERVDQCLQLLSRYGAEAKLVAGGTDLLPQIKNGLLKPACVVDLSGVAELNTLSADAGALHIGAAVSARTLEHSSALADGFKAIADAAGVVGSVQVRNLATVGGNICNAAPSADLAPPLIALGGVAVIAGPGGRREVSLDDFFTGVRRTVLGPGELLVEIRVPTPAPGTGGSYIRHTPRRELDIAVVGVASVVTVANGTCTSARIVLGAVAPTPVRASEAEAALIGKPLSAENIERAAELAVGAARPISDQRGSAEFRRHLVRVLTRRTLQRASERV